MYVNDFNTIQWYVIHEKLTIHHLNLQSVQILKHITACLHSLTHIYHMITFTYTYTNIHIYTYIHSENIVFTHRSSFEPSKCSNIETPRAGFILYMYIYIYIYICMCVCVCIYMYLDIK
jgi:hypothetical protein